MRLWVRVYERIETLLVANEPWAGRFVGGVEIYEMLGFGEALKRMGDPMEAYADRLITDCRELATDWRLGLNSMRIVKG